MYEPIVTPTTFPALRSTIINGHTFELLSKAKDLTEPQYSLIARLDGEVFRVEVSGKETFLGNTEHTRLDISVYAPYCSNQCEQSNDIFQWNSKLNAETGDMVAYWRESWDLTALADHFAKQSCADEYDRILVSNDYKTAFEEFLYSEFEFSTVESAPMCSALSVLTECKHSSSWGKIGNNQVTLQYNPRLGLFLFAARGENADVASYAYRLGVNGVECAAELLENAKPLPNLAPATLERMWLESVLLENTMLHHFQRTALLQQSLR